MRRLYHFPQSPFSRRARLCLAHKKLEVELRDARGDEAQLEEARRLTPLKTVPVLVEDDGRALSDSGAISHYLDRAYSTAPLWPTSKDDALLVFEVAALVDAMLEMVINTGNRFYALHEAAPWKELHAEMLSRIQRALDGLASRVESLPRHTVAASGWSAADIWLFTAVAWLEALPARAPTFPIAAQLVSIGWRVPPALRRWADGHRDRGDVRALD